MGQVSAGLNAKMYRFAALFTADGVPPASPILVDTVGDTAYTYAANEADGSRRKDKRKTYVPTQPDSEITAEIPYEIGDANILAFKTAARNQTPIAIAMMDGLIATSGMTGFGGNFIVSKLDRADPLSDVSNWSLSLKPSEHVDDIVIGGGA